MDQRGGQETDRKSEFKPIGLTSISISLYLPLVLL